MNEHCHIYIMGFTVLKKRSYSLPPRIYFGIFLQHKEQKLRTKSLNIQYFYLQ